MNPPEPSSSQRARKAHLRMVPASSASVETGTPSGGPLSLDEAYRRYAPYVAAIALRILGRSADLDDLVQDVFLEATRGIASLADPHAIKGWLARIAVRASVRKLRRRRFLHALQLIPRQPLDYESLASPDANPEQRALVARVYEALDALSAADRAAWVLRHVQGETLEEAAELCACSLSTYQRRLRRASAHIDKELPDA
jgi:RNA polymerase sigma-70 factor (ECF subfamily)